jgi:hypothetical protein
VQQAHKDFSPGGKVGQALGSFSLAINHAGQLMDTIDRLGNGDTELVNKGKNALAESNRTWDPNRSDAVAEFKTLSEGLVGEATKIFSGTGGATDMERRKMDEVLDRNAPRGTQITAAKKLVEMMSARVDVAKSQWDNAFRGTKPFTLVTPEAQRVLDSKFGGLSASASAPTSAPATSTAPGHAAQTAQEAKFLELRKGGMPFDQAMKEARLQ